MSSEIPRHAPETQTDIETGIIPYGDIIDEKIRNRQLGESVVDMTADQNDTTVISEKVIGTINSTGSTLSTLGGRENIWKGRISAKERLQGGERDTYYMLLEDAIVAVKPGSQRGCIDGRMTPQEIVLGPKTAGGTIGDAMRLMLASHAENPNSALNYEQALERILSIEKKLGYKSGGHELEQCGAFKFATDSISMIADHSDVVENGVQIFFGTVGQDYSAEVQDRITSSAATLKSQLGDIIPGERLAAEHVLAENPKACPTLQNDHQEIAVVVFTKPGATLDNNRLIASTKQAFGSELQAFSYNWDYHLAVADELGGRLGEYYLQSVASQDIGALSQLTDGTLDIVAFEPAK